MKNPPTKSVDFSCFMGSFSVFQTHAEHGLFSLALEIEDLPVAAPADAKLVPELGLADILRLDQAQGAAFPGAGNAVLRQIEVRVLFMWPFRST